MKFTTELLKNWKTKIFYYVDEDLPSVHDVMRCVIRAEDEFDEFMNGNSGEILACVQCKEGVVLLLDESKKGRDGK